MVLRECTMASLSLWADVSQLSAVRDFVAKIGGGLDLDERAINDLELAVDEACTNVVQHAYGGKEDKLEVTIEASEEAIQVIIRDWGQAFDPLAVPIPDITVPLDRRPLGGLGLFLMRRVMDQIEFRFDRTNGNTLTMIKRLDRRNNGIRNQYL
jgi:anti-sigma regulatory factor (Ser/Thr protein kinase)